MVCRQSYSFGYQKHVPVPQKEKHAGHHSDKKIQEEETGYAIVKNGIVAEFKEKPTIKLGMAECLGIYILDSRILKFIKSKKAKGKELNLSYDVLQPLSKRGKISAYDIGKEPWIDVDSPSRVEREKDLVNNIIKKL